jgi:hypothetical protein
MTNSKVLGLCLSNKGNSPNPSFREHDCSAPKVGQSDRIAVLVPSWLWHQLSDRHHWRQCEHESGAFTCDTTDREAANLNDVWRSAFRLSVPETDTTSQSMIDAAHREWATLVRDRNHDELLLIYKKADPAFGLCACGMRYSLCRQCFRLI